MQLPSIVVSFGGAIALAVAAPTSLAGDVRATPQDLVNTRASRAEHRVPLVAIADTRTDTLWGMSNVFFEARPGMALPSAARPRGEPEATDLVGNAGVAPVIAVRWRDADSVWRYAVDTNGDSIVADEAPLTFYTASTAGGAITIADFHVGVRPRGAARASARRVPMQLLFAGEYTYARPRETFIGMWHGTGQRMAVRVRPRGRQGVLGASLDDLDIAFDLDHDGAFRARRDPVAGAAFLATEDVSGRPFVAGGRAWVVAQATRGELTITSVPRDTEVVGEGFTAPLLRAGLRGVGGEQVTLTRARGDSLTVVEFWATDCPFSEMARPTLNALREEYAGAAVRWFSIARDRDEAVVDAALVERPRSLTIAHVRWTDWLRFNPRTITPTYLVLDARGKVLLHETGGARTPILGAALRRAIGRVGDKPSAR